MDSMLSAIKARRSGGKPEATGMMDKKSPEMPMEQAQAPQEMGDLLMSLAPEQKAELLQLLVQEQSEGGAEADPQALVKGAPSQEEKGEIEQEIASDDQGSDDIQMSMLDRNSLSKAEKGARPQGLGDRAKMDAAKKLKAKGKMK